MFLCVTQIALQSKMIVAKMYWSLILSQTVYLAFYTIV